MSRSLSSQRFSFVWVGFLCSSLLVLNPAPLFSEEQSAAKIPEEIVLQKTEAPKDELLKIEGEILEVEELKEPKGSAIYTVKDLATGKTLQLFADSYRSLIYMGGVSKPAGDILGGSKVTIIYRKSPDREMPEIAFAKVAGSHHS